VKFRVVLVGRSRCKWANLAVADYTKRLRRFGGVSEQIIRPEVFRGDVEQVRRAESERISASLKPRDQLVVLDERGTDLDTTAFAARIDSQTERNR
jgi:23S rRNA (pseudouridine1915-N3)-methyltransferase